ncbi:Rhs element Vgr protein [Minicystis rosea]|nr:Rhs element Vgr protein [Minicystis rosea]
MNKPEQKAVRIASGDELRVRTFSLKQAINELFAIEIVALSENADVDFDAVIGHPAGFSLVTAGATVRWEGVCSEARLLRWEAGGLSTYRLVIVPRAWLLTQRRNHRIFQMKSELDIVQQTLAEAGVAVVSRVDASKHTPRKYRVQYAETDFAFVSRMMEDAGISYYFETQGDETVMVLDDAPEKRAGHDRALVFQDEPTPEVRHATQLTVTQRVRSERAIPGDLGAVRASAIERHLHGVRGAAKQIQLRTNAIDLVPGVITTVEGHPHRAVAGRSLLVVGSTIEGDGSDTVSANVTLAPTDASYRPEPKTPRPKVQGVESATVVGPVGEAIHTDELGRVRVHFHWDREGDFTENDSCWIPASQPWSGGSFGSVNLPRVGQEVLVEFLGGDPDQPVVIGRVFTEAHPPPYKLPDHKHVFGIRSEPGPRLMAGAADGMVAGADQSIAGLFPGGVPYSSSEMGQFVTKDGPFQAVSPNAATHGLSSSEMTFDDTHGNELAYFQAQKNANSLIKDSKTSVIGNSRACTVGTDDQLNVENSQQMDIGSNQTVTIGGDRTWTITGNVVQNVGHNYSLLTNDSIVHATDGRIDYYAQGNILVHSPTQITLRVGGSFIKLTPDNITIQSGDRVDINPMQGTKEYQDQKAAKEKAEAKAAAQKKIDEAQGAEKNAYDKAKNFQDHRGDNDGKNTQRWNEFRQAADNANMDDQEVMNTYNTAHDLDRVTGKPLP